MAEKKYLSFEGLVEYDRLIKAEFADFELITADDIDTICGATVEAVSADEAIF